MHSHPVLCGEEKEQVNNSKRGGEMVEKERIRELLEKQLELLSEQSRGDPAMLPQLTDSMVQVVSLLRSL